MSLVFALFPILSFQDRKGNYLKTFHLCDFVTYALEKSNFLFFKFNLTELCISAAAHMSIKEQNSVL